METSTEVKKLSHFEIDELIFLKLKEAKLSLLSKKLPPFSYENGIESIRSQFVSRNKLTILCFYQYCSDHMYEAFLGESNLSLMDKAPDSSDYACLAIIAGGCFKGLNSFNIEKSENPEQEHLGLTVPELFSKEEFQIIGNAVVDLLVKFPKQVIEARQWVEEHIHEKKNQIDALTNLVIELQKGNLHTDDSSLNEAIHNVDDTVLPPTSHSLLWIQKRNQVGILTPPAQLIVDLDRILTYMDILSYGGFRLLKNDDLTKIRFVR